jgi:hypothetical protein
MTTPEDEEFDRTANIPLAWQITARQLISAANGLREGLERSREKAWLYASKMPVLLLYGLAAENLVKAILVAKGTPAVKKGTLTLNEEIKGHDLQKLCGKARVRVSNDDTEILNILSWTVQSGKYPVGTKPAVYPGDPTPLWVNLTNLARVCDVLDLLEDELRTTGLKWVLPKEDLRAIGL